MEDRRFDVAGARSSDRRSALPERRSRHVSDHPSRGQAPLRLPRGGSEIPYDLGYLIRPIPEPPTDFNEFVCLEDQLVPAWRLSGNRDAAAPPEIPEVPRHGACGVLTGQGWDLLRARLLGRGLAAGAPQGRLRRRRSRGGTHQRLVHAAPPRNSGRSQGSLRSSWLPKHASDTHPKVCGDLTAVGGVDQEPD
jgi:hypothetical protein